MPEGGVVQGVDRVLRERHPLPTDQYAHLAQRQPRLPVAERRRADAALPGELLHAREIEAGDDDADPRLEQAHQQVEIRPVDLIAAQERDGDRAPELPQALQDGVLEVRIVHGQVRQIPFEAMPQRPPERARAARGLGRQQAGIEQQADLAAAGAARRPPSGAPWPACRCRGSPR